jgi:hypothetical protein
LRTKGTLVSSTRSIAIAGLAAGILSGLPAKAATIFDVAFVMDGSGSIEVPGWDLEKAFVETAIQTELPLDETDISVTSFSTTVTNEIAPLSLLDSSSESTFVTDVANLAYPGETTHTKDGVQAAIDLLAADTTLTDPRLLVLITDGDSNPATTQDPCSLAPTIAADGITVLIVDAGRLGVSQASCLVSDTATQVFSSSTVKATDTSNAVGMAAEAAIGAFATPEPGSLSLLLAGLMAASSSVLRWRRRPSA